MRVFASICTPTARPSTVPRLAVIGLSCGLLIIAGGCDTTPGEGPAKEIKLPRERPRVSYRPPLDGKLQPKQVEMYLSVLSRLQSGGQPTPRPGSKGAAGLLSPGEVPPDAPADIATAAAMGLNVEEYLWVRERVLDAEAALASAKLNQDMLAMLDRTIADIKARREVATDEPSRRLIEEQIASFTAERDRERREAAQREPESTEANMKLLLPQKEKLTALKREVSRMLREQAASKVPPATALPTEKNRP